MLVLAPAACILSGIALSQAFDVFTRSIKLQLPSLSVDSHVDVSIFSLIVIKFGFFFSSSHSISFPCSNCAFDYQGWKCQFRKCCAK